MSYGPYSLRSVRPLVMRETWPRRFISALTLALARALARARVLALAFPLLLPRLLLAIAGKEAPTRRERRREGSADASGVGGDRWWRRSRAWRTR